MDQIWTDLIASGPVAMVLGVAVWRLWQANRDDKATAAAERERLRAEFFALVKAEADRHQKEEEEVRREYIDTLKSIANQVKGDPHA